MQSAWLDMDVASNDARESQMTTTQAIEIMGTSKPNDERRCGTDGAIATIANALTTNMSDADLCDWIANGSWSGEETIESVQTEIDELELANAD